MAQKKEIGSLSVLISGIRDTTGTIAMGLYKSASEWPMEPSLNFSISKAGMSGNLIKYSIDSLPCGEYAISILDDELENSEMDYGFLGIPMEGWGFSNNPASLKIKPPDFEECLFPVNQNGCSLVIEINYIGGNKKKSIKD